MLHKIKKLVKVLLIIYCCLVIMSLFTTGCFSFRLTQKQVDKAFAGYASKPIQHNYTILNRTINYAAIGTEGLPVALFVHGSPGSWSAFVDFMKDTALLSKVKIVAVDRAGFGNSNFGVGEKSLEVQAALLKPVVEKYKLTNKKIILIGHSLGGPLIARMAMDYPTLIDNLIIVAGSISPYLEPREKWFRIPLNFTPLNILLPNSFKASNKEILYLKDELIKMLPLWQQIKIPVTLIQGGKDVLVSPANAAFAQKMLTQTKVTIIKVDSMTHFVPWTHPQLIKQAIYQALEQ